MILVVEDELISRKALTSLLAASGYDTAAVETAEEAVEVVRNGKVPQVALVDLDLPGMSGIELIEYLERHVPTVQSVIITASSREKIERFRQAHDVPFVRKPVDFHDLLRLIHEREHLHH